MDLGECPKIHDNALRADYNNAKLKKDYFYDIDVSKTPLKVESVDTLKQRLIKSSHRPCCTGILYRS